MSVYLVPPMPTVGPYPMSMFHVSLYLVGILVGLVFLLFAFIVAVEPASRSGAESCWKETVGSPMVSKCCSRVSGRLKPID